MASRKSPNYQSIAQHAHVSVATVDRVMNGRASVSTRTIQRVLNAAREVGYLSDEQVAEADSQPLQTILFLLPDGEVAFLKMLSDAVEFGRDHYFASGRVKITVAYVERFSADALAQALLKNSETHDAIAFVALDHPVVRETVTKLTARGFPLFTVISDLANSNRLAYIGLNNRGAGRTAGDLIGRFLSRSRNTSSPKVAIISGNLSYSAHIERETGFRQMLREKYPSIDVVGTKEGLDDSKESEKQMDYLLLNYPDLAGVYCVGDGTVGVGRSIERARQAEKPVYIGHGLTPNTRALLVSGTMDATLSTNLKTVVANCVQILKNSRSGKSLLEGTDDLRTDIFIRENLP